MIILSIYTAEWFLNVLTTQMTSPLRFPQISLPALVFKVSELASNDYQIKNKSGVYAFYCITEHKFYIGSAKCLYKRIKSHIANKDSNRNLQKAFRLFGQNDFFILILVFIKVDSILNIKDIASIALKTKSNVTRGLNNFKKSVAGQSPALTSHHAKHGGVDPKTTRIVHAFGITQKKDVHILNQLRSLWGIAAQVKLGKNQAYLLETTNSRVIENLTHYFSSGHTLKGMKAVEFRIWQRSYFKHKGDYLKLHEIRELVRNLKSNTKLKYIAKYW